MDYSREGKIVKKENAITIVSLIVTIIIIIILAGVSIALLSGDNGILNMAERARNSHQYAQESENGTLSQYENLMNGSLKDESIKLAKYTGTSQILTPDKLQKGYYGYDLNRTNS